MSSRSDDNYGHKGHSRIWIWKASYKKLLKLQEALGWSRIAILDKALSALARAEKVKLR